MIRFAIALQLMVLLSAFSQTSSHVASSEGLFSSNLYTGTPNVRIPVHDFSSRDIQIPVSLVYTGGNGIRVNEESGLLGSGWHLQAGGFITQIVRGYDDFHPQNGYLIYSKDVGPITLPCFQGEKSFPLAGDDQKDCYGQDAAVSDLGALDLEPDIFVLNLSGHQLKFFFDKLKRLYTSEMTTLVISIDNSVPDRKFLVKSPEGINYTFEFKEVSVNDAAADERFKNQGRTWHLTSAYSIKTKETISFTYETSGYPSYRQNKYAKTIYTSIPEESAIALWPQYIPKNGPINSVLCKECANLQNLSVTKFKICPQEVCAIYGETLSAQEVVETKRTYIRLTEIKSRTGKLIFKTTYPHYDQINLGQNLIAINYYVFDEKGRQKLISQHQMEYELVLSPESINPEGTFFTHPYPGVPLYNSYRYLLKSIHKIGSDGITATNPYLFSYNPGNLPYKTSLDIDRWGYYNYDGSKAHNTSLVSKVPGQVNRESSSVAASAMLLQSVKEPSGKQTNYYYEPAAAGVRLSKISESSTEGNLNGSVIKYQYISNLNYRPTFHSSYKQILFKDYEGQSGCCPYEAGSTLIVNNPNNPTIFCGAEYNLGKSMYTCSFQVQSASTPSAFSDATTIAAENYTMISELYGEQGEFGKIEYQFPEITYQTSYFPFVPVTKNPMEGNMIKKTEYKNEGGIFRKVSESEFDYTFQASGAGGGIESTDQTGATAIARNTNANGLKIFLDFNGNRTRLPIAKIYGYRMQLSKLLSITTTSKRFDQSMEALFLSSTTTQQFNKFGQLQTASVSKDGTGIEKTTLLNNMSDVVASLGPIYGNPGWLNLPDNLPLETYTYRKKGNLIVSGNAEFNRYDYNPGNLLLEKWVATSPITPITKLSTSSGIRMDAKYRKILQNTYSPEGNLIQQSALLNDNGYNAVFLHSSTIWGYYNSLPYAIVQNADVSQIAYNGFETGSLPGANGWLRGFGCEIAEKSLKPDDVFSGNYSLKLFPGFSGTNYSPICFIKPVSQNGKYKFSCWIKLGAALTGDNVFVEFKSTAEPVFGAASYPSVSDAYKASFPVKSVTGWQYVETIIDLDRLKLSGNLPVYLGAVVGQRDPSVSVFVDDMRLHPVNAQMSTYTYEAGIGKTSEAGADSKPVHYEYDALGRLLYIRDFRRNIIKKHQYLQK